MTRSALAPAKVNLLLHVGPLQADGYHPLVSLAAFADVGDRVSVRPAERLSLSVSGRFGRGLEGDDNLVLQALRALSDAAGIGEPPLAVALDKALPVASGLGGGSSDAGAALKLARDVLELPLDDDALARIAADLGADGALCLHGRAAWAEGRGERLRFEPRLPPLAAVLVNPGVPSPTGAVYRAYDASPNTADIPPAPTDWSAPGLIRWLAGTRNDLEPPAVALNPVIGDSLDAVRRLPGVRLTRMSGSGATVFGLFDAAAAAERAAASLRADHPDWWITSTLLS